MEWKIGDKALCVADGWGVKKPDEPKVGDIKEVDRVENGTDMFGLRPGIYIGFTDTVCKYISDFFVKLNDDELEKQLQEQNTNKVTV